jgi:hypothetical protein
MPQRLANSTNAPARTDSVSAFTVKSNGSKTRAEWNTTTPYTRPARSASISPEAHGRWHSRAGYGRRAAASTRTTPMPVSRPVDAFTVVFGGTLAFFVIAVVLLGLFSDRSPREYLDWKPTRSPEAEAQNELDDVAQMIEAQNELKRRRGAPEISEEEIEQRVREDEAEKRRWRES